MFSNIMHAVDTARATAFLLDEHSTIIDAMDTMADMIKHFSQTAYYKVENIEAKIKDTLRARQRYFADRTLSILDNALKIVIKLKPVGKVSPSDLEIIKSKIQEMKYLARELRILAYKDPITSSDVDRAMAIIRNMENLANDIRLLALEILDKAKR